MFVSRINLRLTACAYNGLLQHFLRLFPKRVLAFGVAKLYKFLFRKNFLTHFL